jgi:hypothetical protein
MKLYRRDSLIYVEDGTEKFYVSQGNIDISISPTGSNMADMTFRRINGIVKKTRAVSEILNYYDNVYGTTVEDLVFAIFNGQDVNVQDQTTPVVIAKFSQTTNQTTLSVAGSIDDTTITLASATGAAAGKYITLFNPTEERYSVFTQIGAAAGSVITLDTPLDFAYPVGTFIDIGTTNMAVDGSSTTQVFGLRGGGTPPGVALDADITRLIFTCLTTTAPQLNQFGNITALTKGLVCRRRNDAYYNIFNVKDNIGIAGIMFDFQLLSAVGAGQDGFWARLTFAGMNKIGSAQRLKVGEDLEILVQDDLTTGTPNITSLEIVAEGHITKEP